MQINEKLRIKILRSLPKGYAKAVAASCGVSEVTVYRVLHHSQKNRAVSEALICLASETKAKQAKNQKRVLQLMKSL